MPALSIKSPAILKTAGITLPLLFLLTLVALFNPVGDFWGTVESPKAQVESYDSGKIATAKTLDSSIYDWRKLNRLLREPQNTLSNLAYVATGLLVAFSCRQRASMSFAIACVFLGLGSGLYHASLLPEWRMLDILGVYAVLFCLLLVGVSAVTQISRAQLPVISLTWLAAFYAGIHRNDVRIFGFKLLDSTYVVVACVTLGVALALLVGLRIADRRHYFGWLGALGTTGAIAFFGGLTDRFGGLWANPELCVQGHSVWHLFGAIALLATYEIFTLTGYDRSVFALQPGPPPKILQSLTAGD